MNLSEHLGFAATDRLLIVNCDDVGSSHSANVGAFMAMTSGIATSSSLMIPCPWALAAAKMFKGLPMGVHLTLTSEHEGYRWRSLTGAPSLRDATGFLPSTAALALDQMQAKEARAECAAQVELALTWGIDVTHIDVHMDVLHANETLFTIYLELATHFELPIRLPYRAEYPARDMATARGILFTDHLIYPWPRPTRDVLRESIPAMPGGVTELFAHPVIDGEELRGYDTEYAAIRVHDAEALTDPAMSELLDHNRIHRISYRELRSLQRQRRNW